MVNFTFILTSLIDWSFAWIGWSILDNGAIRKLYISTLLHRILIYPYHLIGNWMIKILLDIVPDELSTIFTIFNL